MGIYNKSWLARPATAIMLPRKMLELADKAEPAPVLCGLWVPEVPFALDPSLTVAFPELAQISETFSSSSAAPETVEEAEEVLEAEAEAVLDAEVAVAVADGRAAYG